MKKHEAIKNQTKGVKDRLRLLKRNELYFVKGYKIDEVPLQLTHFYEKYLRFKVIAWPYKSPSLNSVSSIMPLVSSIQKTNADYSIRLSRLKRSGPPKLKINHSMSIKEIRRRRVANLTRLYKKIKVYINLNYSTLEKCDYISFEKISFEDLPLFISDANPATHLNSLLGTDQ